MTPLRQTHTFATLEISGAAYDEIRAKLVDAGYQHAFIDDAIDMSGIGLVRIPVETISGEQARPLEG